MPALPYTGSGPYCYSNCIAMMLGPHSPGPSTIEVLTGEARTASAGSTLATAVSYLSRSGFERVRDVGYAHTWYTILVDEVPLSVVDSRRVPPGTLGGGPAVEKLADMVADGVDPGVRDHLIYFAVRVGVRRLVDAATTLGSIGLDNAAAIATEQAQLVGSLQYDLVAGSTVTATSTLRRLAPTYARLHEALTTAL